MSYGLETAGRVLGDLVGRGNAALQQGAAYGAGGAVAGAAGGAIIGTAGVVTGPGELVIEPAAIGTGAVVGGGLGAVYGAGKGVIEGTPGYADRGAEAGKWLSDKIDSLTQADNQAKTRTQEETDTACKTCCKRLVVISRAASPLTAQHILDAQARGQPRVLTLDRPGTTRRRAASLKGIVTATGMDRDEYPPATFAEGGAGASVRLIPLSDNRSAGGQLQAQMNVPTRATEGCKITMTVGP